MVLDELQERTSALDALDLDRRGAARLEHLVAREQSASFDWRFQKNVKLTASVKLLVGPGLLSRYQHWKFHVSPG